MVLSFTTQFSQFRSYDGMTISGESDCARVCDGDNGNSFEQLIHRPLGCPRLHHRPERVVVRSAEAASDAFISKSLEAMLITVVAFIIRTISHHIFSSFRETTFQKIGGLPAPVL